MKSEFTLTGTENNGFWHRYSIEKNNKFRNTFLKFMRDIGFDGEKLKKKFQEKYEDNSDDLNPVFIKWIVNADEITDRVWSFKNEKYDVDVFFGDKKVFLVIRTKDRGSMIDLLKKDISWKNGEEFEKIRAEKNKRMKQRALNEIERHSKVKQAINKK
ncbi:hypothetical protein HY449_03635 [Candidatus Pacearchaeota archaeon]|nr:hypothetical protein [Candidatus Pacearchaeota archaeon]